MDRDEEEGCHFRNTYHRIKSRRGSQRAIIAVDHALLKTIYAVLRHQRPYEEPQPKQFTEVQRNRRASFLSRQLRQLGYDVTLKRTEVAA